MATRVRRRPWMRSVEEVSLGEAVVEAESSAVGPGLQRGEDARGSRAREAAAASAACTGGSGDSGGREEGARSCGGGGTRRHGRMGMVVVADLGRGKDMGRTVVLQSKTEAGK